MKITNYLCSAFVAVAIPASAAQYDFSTVQSGDTPGGTSPFARLTVLQDAPNVVSLQLEALHLASSEFISLFEYNIAGTATTASIAAFDDATGGVGSSTYILFGGLQVDAGITYDAAVDFPTSNANGGAARFMDGESFLFKLTRPGLTPDDIDLDMMIHIQGIAPAGTSSKVIATLRPQTPGVPEAGSTIQLLGAALAGLVALRNRTR